MIFLVGKHKYSNMDADYSGSMAIWIFYVGVPFFIEADTIQFI